MGGAGGTKVVRVEDVVGVADRVSFLGCGVIGGPVAVDDEL